MIGAALSSIVNLSPFFESKLTGSSLFIMLLVINTFLATGSIFSTELKETSLNT